eukprot:TRINITY_DN2621_c0_g1_i2.p2 TRINITY_DN2621_c0_g1~~TRINITY_DN2621_c0_g1_i2.p2  ORF type:complete len:553 (+),score=134.31 TRINITY_DN2621_c0_g1_i2:134-1792(+)
MDGLGDLQTCRVYFNEANEGLGFTFVTARDVEGTTHLHVEEVHPGTPCARAGLPAGIELVAVDDQPVSNSEELRRAVQQFRESRRLELRLQYRSLPESTMGAPPDGHPGNFAAEESILEEPTRQPSEAEGAAETWDFAIVKMAEEGLGVALGRDLVLNGVDSGSPADAHGVGAALGWQLFGVNGDAVYSLRQVADAVVNAERVDMRFVRLGQAGVPARGFERTNTQSDLGKPPGVATVLGWLGLSAEGYHNTLRAQGFELASDLVGVAREELVAMGLLPGHANRVYNMIARMAREADEQALQPPRSQGSDLLARQRSDNSFSRNLRRQGTATTLASRSDVLNYTTHSQTRSRLRRDTRQMTREPTQQTLSTREATLSTARPDYLEGTAVSRVQSRLADSPAVGAGWAGQPAPPPAPAVPRFQPPQEAPARPPPLQPVLYSVLPGPSAALAPGAVFSPPAEALGGPAVASASPHVSPPRRPPVELPTPQLPQMPLWQTRDPAPAAQPPTDSQVAPPGPPALRTPHVAAAPPGGGRPGARLRTPLPEQQGVSAF